MSIAYEQKAALGLQELGLTIAYDQLDSTTQSAVGINGHDSNQA